MKCKIFVSMIAAVGLAIFSANAQQESMLMSQFENPISKYAKAFSLQTAYSVDVESTVDGFPLFSGKTYQDGDEFRMDVVMSILNLKLTAIQKTRDGEITGYLIAPAGKKFMVVKPDASSGSDDEMAEVTIIDLGKEMYNGEMCDKKRLATKGNVVPPMEPMDVEILFSPKQRNMPVKTAPVGNEAFMSIQATYTNYNFEKPNASLFTAPKDYTEVTSMDDLISIDDLMPSGELFDALMGITPPSR